MITEYAMRTKGTTLTDGDIPKAPLPTKTNWAEKLGPKRISHKHEFIIHLAALGISATEIAHKTGYTNARLSIILNNGRIVARITALRKELFSKDPDQLMKLMIPQAVNVVREVLENPQERGSTRLDAAFRLFDRTHGKPKQSIDVGGSLIRDLFAQLDALKEQPVIDVTQARSAEPQDADVIDEWVRSEYAKDTTKGTNGKT